MNFWHVSIAIWHIFDVFFLCVVIASITRDIYLKATGKTQDSWLSTTMPLWLTPILAIVLFALGYRGIGA